MKTNTTIKARSAYIVLVSYRCLSFALRLHTAACFVIVARASKLITACMDRRTDERMDGWRAGWMAKFYWSGQTMDRTLRKTSKAEHMGARGTFHPHHCLAPHMHCPARSILSSNKGVVHLVAPYVRMRNVLCCLSYVCTYVYV